MQTQVSGEIVLCPACQKLLGPLDQLKGRRVRCKSCSYEYTVGGTDHVAPKDPPANEDMPQEESRGVLMWVLDYFEDKLVRMIRGVFRFIFLRIPRFIYRFIVEFSPTMTKLVKVLFLLGLYLAVVFGPLSVSTIGQAGFDRAIGLRRDYPNFVLFKYLDLPESQSFLKTHERAVSMIATSWTSLALAGSAYGLWYLKRKRKTKKV